MVTPRDDLRPLLRRACLGEPVERVPVWLMRQAGRYLPAYQQLRRGGDFLAFCKDPELCARATLDAARLLDVDAAIIFSDITVPADALGLGLRFAPGPIVARPIRTRDDVERLPAVEPRQAMGYVMEAIRLTRAELPAEKSLIGFVGAPLTLAGYLIEGAPSPHWPELKRLLYTAPEVATALLDRLTELLTAHALAQVEAGCDVVQLFDSSAGELPAAELERFAFASAGRVIARLRAARVPVIYFARGIGGQLEQAAALGADVLGLDWSVSVAAARRRLGAEVGLMGNLDPAVLLTTPAVVEARTREILAQARGLERFVFNLGHGVMPPTPVENVMALVETVKRHGQAGAAR